MDLHICPQLAALQHMSCYLWCHVPYLSKLLAVVVGSPLNDLKAIWLLCLGSYAAALILSGEPVIPDQQKICPAALKHPYIGN